MVARFIFFSKNYCILWGLSNWCEVTSWWRELKKGPVSTMVQYCSEKIFTSPGSDLQISPTRSLRLDSPQSMHHFFTLKSQSPSNFTSPLISPHLAGSLWLDSNSPHPWGHSGLTPQLNSPPGGCQWALKVKPEARLSPLDCATRRGCKSDFSDNWI